jgi:hypothetical protein
MSYHDIHVTNRLILYKETINLKKNNRIVSWFYMKKSSRFKKRVAWIFSCTFYPQSSLWALFATKFFHYAQICCSMRYCNKLSYKKKSIHHLSALVRYMEIFSRLKRVDKNHVSDYVYFTKREVKTQRKNTKVFY